VVASWNLFLGDPYGVGLAHEERQIDSQHVADAD
jgi:hypothetical protein